MPIEFADEDPQIEPWPAGEGYIVTYAIANRSGYHHAFQKAAARHLAPLGLEVLHSTDSLMLFGVKPGREADVHAAVRAAAEDVAQYEREQADELERLHPEHEAASQRAEAELESVRDAFKQACENA